MAPSFLSRLVKASPITPSRERSGHSLESPRASDLASRQRSPSTPDAVPPSKPGPPALFSKTAGLNASSASVNTTDSGSTRPNVTVVPPSPRALTRRSSFASEQDLHAAADRPVPDMPDSLVVSPRLRTVSAPSRPPSAPIPDSASRSRPSTPISNLKQKLQKSSSNLSLSQPQDMRRKSSNKSLKIPAPIIVPPHSGRSYTESAETPEAPTVPATAVVTMSPIVESPSNMRGMDGIVQSIPQSAPALQRAEQVNGNSLQVSTPRDSDTMSISSAASTDRKKSKDKDKDKKKSWRGSANSRKPSGLAGVIAASGMAMANPTMSQAQYNASMIQITQSDSNNSRKSSNATAPYSGSHVKSRSVESAKSPAMPSRRRATAASINSDNNSEYLPDPPEYFDLDADSSLEDRTDDETDLDLEDHFPVTGFAVASNKRNADFHELFPNIPDGDYLIEGESGVVSPPFYNLLNYGRLWLRFAAGNPHSRPTLHL